MCKLKEEVNTATITSANEAQRLAFVVVKVLVATEAVKCNVMMARGQAANVFLQ